MTIIRHSVGIAGLLLSGVGLLACLAGAVGVWAAKSRVDRVTEALFTAADDAFEFMAARLVLVKQRIESSRQQVDGLATRVERLQSMVEKGDGVLGAGAESQVLAEVESLRGTFDIVVSELKAAEGWLDSIEAVAQGVNAAAGSIAESQEAGGSENASAGVTAAKVAELAGTLAEALNRLDALRAKLLDMREHRVVVREFAALVITEAADLDTRLGNLSTTIDDLGVRVLKARASSMDAGRRVHGWITLAAVVLTIVALWFGASQVCVLIRASRLCSGR